MSVWLCPLLSILPLAALPVSDELEGVEKKIYAAWERHRSYTAELELYSRHILPGAVSEGRAHGRLELSREEQRVCYRIEMDSEIAAHEAESTARLGQHTVTVVDGQYEYVMQNIMGQRVLAVKKEISRTISPVPREIFARLRAECELKLLPETTVDGQKAYVIEAVKKAGSASASQPATRRAGPAGPPEMVRFVVYFAQETGVFLRTEEFSEDGGSMQWMAYRNFRFDVPIDPGRFVLELPPGASFTDLTTRPTTQPGP
jgi:outer membrane lipoprotein-sorting protein